MNKKILTSALGLVAAAGLAGGSTFAGWSDNYTDANNEVGAGEIVLSVADPNATQEFDKMNLIPGEEADYEFLVTSMQSNATGNPVYIPTAGLTLTLEDVIGTEDGCSNTNGERDDDTADALNPGAAATDCDSPGTDADGNVNVYGDFDDDARVIVNVSAPTTDADACNGTLHPRGNVISTTLRDLADDGAIDLLNGGSLDPGEGICVAMAISLPASVDNASQGDSAEFDVRFDLTQNV